MIEKCQPELLSEYLDEELEAVALTDIERHLQQCDTCTNLLNDLRAVTRQAGALADRQPPHDLWPGIAARIGATVPSPVVVPLRRRVSFSVPQLLAAGFAAVLAGSVVTTLAIRATDSEMDPALTMSAEPPAPEITLAALAVETQYDEAIADLTGILERDRDRLSPRTIRALEENLAVIDGAIQRAREALMADPESDYLRDHFDRTVRQKLDLLRRAQSIVSQS